MLALIPILAFLSLFLVLRRLFSGDWRAAFLRAAIAWGVYMVVATELLSLFRLVTVSGLAFAWALPSLAGAGWLLWDGRRRRRFSAEMGFRPEAIRQAFGRLWPDNWPDRLLLLGLLTVLGVTALVAWFSPPQTWDSLNYHLSRVARWAQERAVVHYPTGIRMQNTVSPGSEMAMLQFYVLQQSDRLVTFVQWFAMLTSLIAVSRLSRSLGSNVRGQLLAAIFLATLPMGIVQASSTISDYVVAVWILCAAVESMSVYINDARADRLVFASLAAALAIFTKPTSIPYLVPLIVLLAVILLKRLGLGRSLVWVMLALVLVISVNSGHLARNYRFYGDPLGPHGQIDRHRNQLANLQGTTSNLIRHFGMHLGTPWAYVNKGLGMAVQQAHRLLGLELDDPRTTATFIFRIRATNTFEDSAGNPMQAYAILLAIPVLAIGRKRLGGYTVVYAILALSSLVVFSWLFKWHAFGGRYHVAFFALFAPVAGRLLSVFISRNWSATVGGIFLLAAWPWLFSIQSRPLIPVDDSLAGSILVESRSDLYFASARYLANSYTSIVGTIEEARCDQVGVVLGGNSPEYLFWMLLDAPRDDLRVEWIVSGYETSADFTPCAVICQGCPADLLEFSGLPLTYVRDGYQLFVQPQVP